MKAICVLAVFGISLDLCLMAVGMEKHSAPWWADGIGGLIWFSWGLVLAFRYSVVRK